MRERLDEIMILKTKVFAVGFLREKNLCWVMQFFREREVFKTTWFKTILNDIGAERNIAVARKRVENVISMHKQHSGYNYGLEGCGFYRQ